MTQERNPRPAPQPRQEQGRKLLSGYLIEKAQQQSQQGVEQIQAGKQPEAPKNGEQLEQRKMVVLERASDYVHTAQRIKAASFSRSSKYEPEELLHVADLHAIRGLGLGEAVSIINGNNEELENRLKKAEETFGNYTDIVTEFSDKNKNR
jgi:hypothetical protein